RRDAEDGAVVRLAGEITEPAALCDIFAMLSQTSWVGELNVQSEGTIRRVFIENGKVVGARTNVEAERLGRILYRFGAIDQLQYDAILERVGKGQLFGAATMDLGILTNEEIYAYLGKQVEIIALATLTVSDGMYCFLDGFSDDDVPFRHTASLGGLLMDGVTQMDEMRYFRQRIPSADYVPARNPDKGGDPPEAFASLWALVDGNNSITDLGRVLSVSEFGVTKQLFQLLQSKHVVMQPPRTRGGPIEVIEAGNQALRLIHQAADAAGKGTALRTSLEGFADEVYTLMFRGAGPYENGTFEPRTMLANTTALVSGGNVEMFLKEMLYDYVQFALFSVGSLRRDKDKSLSKQVEPLMSKLRPIG
ncbi:MAG: DUF4388 domain-containing protein, partial [Myxococcales bacterium]|nr:DUF4388 domain-containing protein [Myxococcales bacterium]